MIYIKKSPTADSRTAVGNPTKKDLLESSLQHIEDVRNALGFLCDRIQTAGTNHDYTKVDDVGIAAFYDAFSQKLTGDEFKREPWFQRHISEERHHLKDRCPDDVNLVDVMERVADIVTAALARSGTIYEDTLSPEILVKAYKNTIELLKEGIIVVD